MEQDKNLENQIVPASPLKDIPTLEQLEKTHIQYVLTIVGGNKAKAAKILGVSVKTMYNKLAIYGPSEVVSNT